MHVLHAPAFGDAKASATIQQCAFHLLNSLYYIPPAPVSRLASLRPPPIDLLGIEPPQKTPVVTLIQINFSTGVKTRDFRLFNSTENAFNKKH